MKLRIQHILAFFSVLAFSGCAENPPLFSEPDGIYFDTADTSVAYSFAKYPNKTFDTLRIPVKVLGNALGTDRSIGFDVLTYTGDNAAIRDTHFKIVDSQVIPANKYDGTISVVVYRAPDLASEKVVKFSLKLRQDAAFPSEGITSKQKVTINLAYLQKPKSWGDNPSTSTEWAVAAKNFGTWTPTKYKLILDALYDPSTGQTVTEFTGNKFLNGYPIINDYYLTTVKNYLKTKYPGNFPGGSGDQLIDPLYNRPVMVGDASNYY